MIQVAWWAPGPVWTGAENLASNRDSISVQSSPLSSPPLGLHGLSQGRNFPGLNLGYESSYILTAVTITFRVLPYAVL